MYSEARIAIEAKTMYSTQNSIQIGPGIRYLTNEAGEKTDVLVPVDVWEKILELIQAESGLDPIDEQEPTSQILADLQTSIQQAKQGQTSPVSELWDGIDVQG